MTISLAVTRYARSLTRVSPKIRLRWLRDNVGDNKKLTGSLSVLEPVCARQFWTLSILIFTADVGGVVEFFLQWQIVNKTKKTAQWKRIQRRPRKPRRYDTVNARQHNRRKCAFVRIMQDTIVGIRLMKTAERLHILESSCLFVLMFKNNHNNTCFQ